MDFAVVGGGFTGLAAAACLRRLAPGRTVAVFEAARLGAGSSGHTGGLALGETAAGDLPGLGDVLGGVQRILSGLRVECDLDLRGVYELAHGAKDTPFPIQWHDGQPLRVVKAVSGGSIDPGKLLSGLARAAIRLGAKVYEHAPVEHIAFERPLRLKVRGQTVRAKRALVATNAMSLELSGLAGRAQPKFTMAAMTEELSSEQIAALGLHSRMPFYTIDLPYLWGRFLGERLVLGSGLVHLNEWSELRSVDVAAGEAAELIARLQRRARSLHPALNGVSFTHAWGGPILIAGEWKPVFARHPQSPDVLVLGAYSGHGVALSVYLGSWAGEVMLGRKRLPKWGAMPG